jgi:hypothetical protein
LGKTGDAAMQTDFAHTRPDEPQRLRSWILLALSVIASAGVMLHAPIAQPLAYHAFVDQRTIWGIPTFWNMMSNVPFLLFGLIGAADVAGRKSLPFKAAYVTFFAGTCLVAFGSGYYHLAPSNDSLVWDRLTMVIVFMAFFSIIISEYLDERTGRWAFVPLEIAGVASVLYWHITEAAGHGDLRPYIIVQFLPIILIPLILVLFRNRLWPARFMWAVLATYVLAKLLELGDAQVYALGQAISGHSLKHVAAAFGTLFFLLAVRRRFAVVS